MVSQILFAIFFHQPCDLRINSNKVFQLPKWIWFLHEWIENFTLMTGKLFTSNSLSFLSLSFGLSEAPTMVICWRSFSLRSSKTELWKSSLLMPCKSSNGSIGRREGSKTPFSIYDRKKIACYKSNFDFYVVLNFDTVAYLKKKILKSN